MVSKLEKYGTADLIVAFILQEYLPLKYITRALNLFILNPSPIGICPIHAAALVLHIFYHWRYGYSMRDAEFWYLHNP